MKKILKWFERFWFSLTLKIELEAGFNDKDQKQ